MLPQLQNRWATQSQASDSLSSELCPFEVLNEKTVSLCPPYTATVTKCDPGDPQ